MIGLHCLAISDISISVRHRHLKLRTRCLIAFCASLLTAGVKLTKRCFVFALQTILGLNVYPKKVNAVFSYRFRLNPSLQYTIFVLLGCSSKPQAIRRFPSSSSTCLASLSVRQCTKPSSAYRHESNFGYVLFSQVSIA